MVAAGQIGGAAMSWVDIFYLSLVIVAFTGFAGALAFYVGQDEAYRARQAKDSGAEAGTSAKTKAEKSGPSRKMLEAA
jgi:hypothetical protein